MGIDDFLIQLVKYWNKKAEGIPNERITEKIARERKLNPKMISYILNRKQYE